MGQRIVVLHEKDNVGTVVDDIDVADVLGYSMGERHGSITAVDRIPFGFKIALVDIANGEDIVKYGEVIGSASRSIRAGELVHTQNVEGGRGRGDIPVSEGTRARRRTSGKE